MKRTRTFIAIEPGNAIRDRVVMLQEKLAKTGCDVRWAEYDTLHLTLLFLGEVDQRDLTNVCRAVSGVAGGAAPFAITVEGANAFPNIRRPKTLWVGVSAGAQDVCDLHDGIEAALMQLGCYRREERAFTPHLTLGRVKGDVAIDDLSKALTKTAAWTAGETTVKEVLVMGSELKSDGPVYTVLSRAKLG